MYGVTLWVFVLHVGMSLSADGRFEAAERLYREARFADAAQDLEALVKDRSSSKRVDAALLLGACYVALGKDAAARRVFVDAFDLDASVTLPPRSSPKVREAFDKAKAEHASLPSQIAWLEPPSIESPIGAGARLRIRSRNLVGKPYVLTLYWRRTDEVAFRSAPLDVRPDGTATADINPSGNEREVGIAAFVEARENTTLRQSLGSAEKPSSFNVTVRRVAVVAAPAAIAPATTALTPPVVATTAAPAETPLYKKGWFWGAIGGAVVVIAGVVVASAVVVHNSQPPPSGDLQVGFEVAR